ncbi:hypothetical protein ACP70R_032491 [Stipagrostis hirtigluma subsp. patula]
MASRLLIAIVVSVIASLCVAAAYQKDEIMQPLRCTCTNEVNNTDGSQYQKNLAELLSSLPAAAGDNGWFYYGTAGTKPDQVLGRYADRNTTQCRDCLAGAPAGITAVCPGSRRVRAVYDACPLKYSSESFSVTDRGSPYLVNAVGPVDEARMAAARHRLMTELARTAADSTLLLANGSTPYDGDSSELHGLAQCTRDLTPTQCADCLTANIGTMSKTNASRAGGSIKVFSCYIRYSIAAFDVTLPPPGAAAAAAAAAAAPLPSRSASRGLVIGLCVASSAAFLIHLGLAVT